MKSGWRLESGIEPWVCIYGQKMSHNYWTIYRNSDHSDAIVRRFFWRSVSTRGLFNIELRLRPRQSRPLVCRPLFLFARPQRLLRPLAEPVGRSRGVQQTLPPPPPRNRAATCSQCSAHRDRATGLSTENSTAGGRFGLPWFHEFFVRLALFFIQRQVFNCWGRGIKLPII